MPPFFSIGKILLLLVLWTTAKGTLAIAGFTPEPSCHEYTATTGQKHRHFLWTLEHDEGWTLTSVDDLETHKTWLDTSLATDKWTLQRPASDTSITAWREGTRLRIEGTLNGKPYQRAHNLANLPWYQALSLSLRNHLGEDRVGLEFWTIRPDNLDLHRLMISKTTEEPVPVEEEQIPAYRIEIRLAGWKASFWKGDYWFRRDTGDFVRYQAASGPPGWPPTIIEPRRTPHGARLNPSGITLN